MTKYEMALVIISTIAIIFSMFGTVWVLKKSVSNPKDYEDYEPLVKKE